MADHDDAVEETVMLTRRGRRSQRVDADAPVDPPVADSAGADSAGADPAGAGPAAVDDEAAEPAPEDAVDDRTIAVDRRRSAGGESARAPEEEPSEEPFEDHTVIVDRARGVAAPTGDPDEIEHVEDHTVVVDRGVPPSALVSPPVRLDDLDDLDATIPAAPARRADAEPLPAIYKPRPSPLAPSRPPVVEGGTTPTRVVDEQAVSVTRTARRISAWVLAAVAGACVVSVCGLVALAFVVFA